MAQRKAPKKSAKKRYKRINPAVWLVVRDLYVQGIEANDGSRKYPLLKDLAADNGISESSINRKSAKDNWAEEREKFEEKLRDENDKKKRKDLSKQSTDFDIVSLNMARALQAEIANIIAAGRKARIDLANFQHLEKGPGVRAVDVRQNSREFMMLIRLALTPNQMQQLGNATMSAQKVGKLALGEPTDHAHIEGTIDLDGELKEFFDQVDALSRRIQSDHELFGLGDEREAKATHTIN